MKLLCRERSQYTVHVNVTYTRVTTVGRRCNAIATCINSHAARVNGRDQRQCRIWVVVLVDMMSALRPTYRSGVWAGKIVNNDRYT